MSPFLTAFGRSGYATGILPLALLGLVVSVIVSSLLRCIGSEASFPTLSLGPGRSWRIATGRRRVWLTLRSVLMVFKCSSGFPWEKLIRATSMPARIIWPSVLGEVEAGPMVQTIFVASLAGSSGTSVRWSVAQSLGTTDKSLSWLELGRSL